MACDPAGACTVRICSLDPGQRLEAPWPGARLPQGATPTALGYYPEAQLLIVAVSRQVRPQRLAEAAEGVTLRMSFTHLAAGGAAGGLQHLTADES